MVLNPSGVRHSRGRLRIKDAGSVVTTEISLGTNVGGTARASYPNGLLTTDLAPMIVAVTANAAGGFPEARVACAIVEDAVDPGGIYADANDNPRADLGVIAFTQLGPASGLSGGSTTWTMPIGTRFGTMRVVVIMADSAASCRSIANVDAGATAQYHFDSDGNQARGSVATPALMDLREAGHMGRRAVVAGLDVDLGSQTYPARPTVTVNLDSAGGAGGASPINPKEVKLAVRYNVSASSGLPGTRPKGVLRRVPDLTAGLATAQYNLDNSFAVSMNPLDLVVGHDASLGDAITPSGEKPDLLALPGITIFGLTTAQHSWVFIHSSGHAAGLTFEPASGNVARLNAAQAGSGIGVRTTSAGGPVGVAAYASAAARDTQAPPETNFKRKSPTGSTLNAHPFLETWVVDALGNPVTAASFVLAIKRHPLGTTENQQTSVTGSGAAAGRLRWEYDVGTTDEAANQFKKTNPDPPDSRRHKDVLVTGNAFSGVNEPTTSASQVFGVNSEIHFGAMWTGDAVETTIDANGAPTGFAKRTKTLASGQLKHKLSSPINEATGQLVDLTAPVARDAASRAIDLAGAEALFGSKAIWNVTADVLELAAGEIAGGNADHALDAPLGYSSGSGGDNGFEGKDTSGDARSIAVYMAYADTRTQSQTFALSDDVTNVGFTADVGNYGYRRQLVQLVALDPDFVIVTTVDNPTAPAGASPTICVKTCKVLADGSLVERKPDAPPKVYISQIGNLGVPQSIVVSAPMTAINPDGEGKSANWQYTFQTPPNGSYGVTVSCLIAGGRPTGPGRAAFKVGVPDPDVQLAALLTHPPGGPHARHVEAGDVLHVLAFAHRRSTRQLVDLDTAPSCALLRPGTSGGLDYWDGAAWRDLTTEGPATLFVLQAEGAAKTWSRAFAPSPLADARDVVVVLHGLVGGVDYSSREEREIVGGSINRHDAYAFDPHGFLLGLPTR